MQDDEWRNWNPDAQQRALSMLQERSNTAWKPFYCTKPGCDGKPHNKWTFNHARADQTPPPLTEHWLVWLLLSGRGAGKTRTGSEYTHRITQIAPRIALLGPTTSAIRDVLVEGESGILNTARPDNVPTWEPSKRRLTWPNGAVGTCFSAEEPDRLRGPQFHYAWLDEPAHYDLIEEVWDNLLLGLRLGNAPRLVATTTPKPTPWMKNLISDPQTRISRASTYANLDNLAHTYSATVLTRFEGTRLGKQELYGELLEDVEGALWNVNLIDDTRITETDTPDTYDRIIIGVDPAGSSRKGADETGIVVTARTDNHYYVLADRSGRYTPSQWANATINAYNHYQADAIVVETNFGAEMVASNLRQHGSDARIIEVRPAQNKGLRAEPIVGLYEQGRVHHIGVHDHLETQMCEWVPGTGQKSPDRLDALVHALGQLTNSPGQASISSPLTLAGRPNAR